MLERQGELRQSRPALNTAARMTLLLPVLQGALQVGVLHAETWLLLLSLEGLLISWLAAQQFIRPSAENRLAGLLVGCVNALALAACGLFLGSHLFWITGLFWFFPVLVLVVRPTVRTTLRRAWLGFLLPFLLAFAAAGVARAGMELSRTEADPARRALLLDAAWAGLQVRGSNGTERALLRLRQAQARFALREYEAACRLADDGLFQRDRLLRAVPVSSIGSDVVESLLRLKAQAFYNHAWDKDAEIYTPIRDDALAPESLADPDARVRWGW